jgi:hypothetical protein
VYASIDSTNLAHEHATFKDGLHEMILCEKIYESNEVQGWVNIACEE